jgi:hypothetical protein
MHRGELVAQADITATAKQRVVFVIVAAVMLALWGLSLIPPIQSWGNPHEDGFSYVPLFWATVTCVPIGVCLLLGAVAGRGAQVARARTALLLGGGLVFIVVAFLIFQHIANSGLEQ